ncbi:GNAT family N-acetyltransferase [Arenimonas oryziterrae]|uniref:N-acetyltransferase domain-containing protein n=1 Tax=Arenimonas oryziterrae DSM 21050 = YC6267 TaxID=1121015 RepID=A0A091ATZ6_9GAMM|nr:GNAT family N-acetyltransferase [Arenimonas oryziterrae]KFN42816.1 hypothetical protein N789_11845 [Arenimonas oryziterrae DSM 21050 = YC6267]
MPLDIHHDRDHRRFTAEVDGITCVLEYHLAANTMTITHTGVPQAVGGRGIAGEITQFAFDTARSEGWKVVPACAYAAAYVRRHPDVADLLA